ncbi:WPP domain-interacting protein 1 [Euphorbia peplus]|nr:WPP domain-interacting protein 1 [Euphorbia peplus]
MDSDDVALSLDGVTSVETETDLVVEMSSNGEVNTELQMVDEILMRMELDLACASEKLVNLNVLMMHAATKETEFEATASTKEHLLSDSVEALEFDLLSRILDSEVTEVDKFITNAQEYVIQVRKMISSYEHLGESFIGMEEKLCDSEESLKQSKDQVSEIRKQSARFQRTLSSLNTEENRNSSEGANFLADGRFSESETKMMMQTAEQQRHILRMLEKSLAREMDTEKKLTESRQIEEELKNKLLCLEQELFFTEEEVIDVSERWFTAENAAEVLMATSKELLSKTKMIQFNLNGSVQRESELRSKLDKSVEQLGSKEKMGQFEAISERVASLENQLVESDNRLQHAMASADASLEKENMFYATIRDMENVINDLKSKALKAENRADNVEDKCIMLSESNAELNEELSFLRGRLEGMEASLNQAEETKIAAAKDINFRTKVITDLVMQLAVEREHLHKQMAKLALDNKTLVLKLRQKQKDPVRGYGEHLFPDDITQKLANGSKADKIQKDASGGKTDLTTADSESARGSVRRIDVGVLSFKHILTATLILLISGAAYLFQPVETRHHI